MSPVGIKVWPVDQLLYAVVTEHAVVPSELTRPSSQAAAMTRDQVERGLADGTLERGVTRRTARGTGGVPVPGQLLLPEDVDSVTPPVRGGETVGYLVLDGEPAVATVAVIRWGVRVVAAGEVATSG